MVHTVGWRVARDEALDFWEKRLGEEDTASERNDEGLRFEDPEGLAHQLVVSTVDEPQKPLIADHPEVPSELALQGFDHAPRVLPQPLGKPATGCWRKPLASSGRVDGWEARGESRGGLWAYDEPPAERGLQGAGTVHHVAWASQVDEHERWRERAMAGGAQPTPVIDRFYFRSIYFREPGGVLFEIATLGPGFTADEPPETWARSSGCRPTTSRCASGSRPR